MDSRFEPPFVGTDSEELMIRYLLGETLETETTLFEERLLSDSILFEHLSAVEADLIDTYLHGVLPPERQVRFEERFFASETQRSKVQNAMLLSRRATSASLRSRRRIVWRIASLAAVAAALLVSIVVMKWNSIIRVNEAAPANQALVILSTRLAPTLERGAGREQTISIPVGTDVVRIQVDISKAVGYSSYTATLETADGKQVWRRGELPSPNGSELGLLNVDIPASAFENGVYVVVLEGEKGTSPTLVSEYSFRIAINRGR